jgi:hypothetical protein
LLSASPNLIADGGSCLDVDGCWLIRVVVSWNKTAMKFTESIDHSFHKRFLWSVRCCLIAAPQNNYNSKIKDHWSRITITDTIIVKILKYGENCQNVTQGQEVSICCLKNGADRLARCRVATNLQFVKNTISTKRNKTRYACYPKPNTQDPLTNNVRNSRPWYVRQQTQILKLRWACHSPGCCTTVSPCGDVGFVLHKVALKQGSLLLIAILQVPGRDWCIDRPVKTAISSESVSLTHKNTYVLNQTRNSEWGTVIGANSSERRYAWKDFTCHTLNVICICVTI